MTFEKRFCVECRYCEPNSMNIRAAICRHPRAMKYRHIVSGEWPWCDDMRIDRKSEDGRTIATCGVSGNWWELKSTEASDVA